MTSPIRRRGQVVDLASPGLGRSSLSWGKDRLRNARDADEWRSRLYSRIERGEMRVARRDELSPMAERVTMISRRENGAWKLIPRHADPISSVQAPESVIQQEISRQPSSTQRLDDRLSARPFGGSKQAGNWVRFSQANPLPVLLPDTPEDRREEKYEATSFGRTLLTVWVIQPLSSNARCRLGRCLR